MDKCTYILSEKAPDLSHLGPTWSKLGPNLTSLCLEDKTVSGIWMRQLPMCLMPHAVNTSSQMKLSFSVGSCSLVEICWDLVLSFIFLPLTAWGRSWESDKPKTRLETRDMVHRAQRPEVLTIGVSGVLPVGGLKLISCPNFSATNLKHKTRNMERWYCTNPCQRVSWKIWVDSLAYYYTVPYSFNKKMSCFVIIPFFL